METENNMDQGLENNSEAIKSEELLYNIISYNNNSEEKPSDDIKENTNNDQSQEKDNNTKTQNSSKKIANIKSKTNQNTKSKTNATKKSKSPFKNSKSPNKNENSKSPNNNSRNTKKTNVIKKPFIIAENQTDPYKKVRITINACSFLDEYMMPIWCNKNSYIKFKVEGKWKIGKLYEFTDSKGMPSNHSTGFNYGALIGRVGLDKKPFEFLISNEACIFIKKEGPLFLRRNLPKKLKIEPEGKLEVIVYDAEYMEMEKINKKIDWNEYMAIDHNNENENNKKGNSENNNKNTNSNIKKIELEEKELEKNLMKLLNNLRMNPTKFHDIYIKSKLLETYEFLIKNDKKEKKVEKEKKEALSGNEKCYQYLENFFKLPSQLELKKKINNLNENILKMDEDIEYFLYAETGKTVKTKTKITQKDNLIEIILQYLLDKKFRTYIFSSKSQSLAIKVLKNYINNSSTLVNVSIILDKDYSL